MPPIPPHTRPISYWTIYNLVLLAIVTLAGVIMRLMPFAVVPGMNYEHLLHAHTHLAFLGWVYNALFIGLVWTFLPKESKLISKYHTLFWITQAVTICMFIAFLFDGYHAPAIGTLALHTVMSYFFIIYFLKDTHKQTDTLPGLMMKCALFCLFISSLGPFAIPVIQSQSMNADHIKLAVNFYLHFQYNGWFVFGLLAIIFKSLGENVTKKPLLRRGAVLLLTGVFPAYFLSIQWVGLPVWLYWLAALGGVLQFLGACSILWILYTRQDQWSGSFRHGLSKWLLLGFTIFVIKCLFQMLSVFPVIYEMVFHSRNVMIAYLHWHFLGFTTLSILIIFWKEGGLPVQSKLFRLGLVIFITGFFIQEIYLFTQGVLIRFDIIIIEMQLEVLLLAALLFLMGTGSLLVAGIRRVKKSLLYLLLVYMVFGIINCQDSDAQNLSWTKSTLLFEDSGTKNWQQLWMLDGQRSEVVNTKQGMELIAGPEHGNDTCHTVLWTKQSFEGNISIEYDYTRTDTTTRCVNILYFHATGKGDDEYPANIALWNDKRVVPSMGTYFNNMNTYHISYAAFGANQYSGENDYVRLRRYNPIKEGLNGTDIPEDHFTTGLFKTNVTYHIQVFRYNQLIEMHVQNKNDTKEHVVYQWDASRFPLCESGRIGLRHMYTRSARYKDFKVWRLKPAD